jgi:hypothetical protein
MYSYLDYQSKPEIHDLEAILSQLVDADGICSACGQNHGFQPDFEEIRTSIDNVFEIFRRRLLNV